MPYSFTEIERSKSWVVRFVFFILILIYFITAWVLGIVFKVFVLKSYSHSLPTALQSIIILVIALIAGIIHWYMSTSNLTEKVISSLGAKDLDPKDGYHQLFRNILDEVTIATGGKKVRAVVIPSSSLNAFAVSDYSDNNVIGVTEGLLARLKRHQLEAVIGHEMAHVVSGDSLVTSVICSLFGLYRELLNKIKRGFSSARYSRTGSRGGGGLPLAITITYFILLVVVSLSNLLKMFMSRQREYRADAIAIRLTRDPLGLGQALYIISSGWRGAAIRGEGLSPLFILSPQYKLLNESEGFFANLFSTHPPINKRIEIAMDMAHANPAELPILLEKRKKPILEKPITPVILPEEKKSWLIYNEGKWEGPLFFESLLTLKNLKPDTWVREPQAAEIKMAYQDDKIRAIFKKEGTGSEFLCPHCNTRLATALYEQSPIFYCTYCDGKLLEGDKIVRIISREDEPFSAEVVKIAEIIKQEELRREPKMKAPNTAKLPQISCPACRNTMERKFYSLAYHVEIDRCWQCGLYWFDKFELEVLQYLIESSRKIE